MDLSRQCRRPWTYLGDEAIDEVINKAVLVLENGVVSGVPGYLYQDWGAVKDCFDDVFEDTILPGGDVDPRACWMQAKHVWMAC